MGAYNLYETQGLWTGRESSSVTVNDVSECTLQCDALSNCWGFLYVEVPTSSGVIRRCFNYLSDMTGTTFVSNSNAWSYIKCGDIPLCAGKKMEIS